MPGIQILQKKNCDFNIFIEQIKNISYDKSYIQPIIFKKRSITVFDFLYQNYPIIKFVINEINGIIKNGK